MIKEKTVTAIILIAGNSTRFKKNRNKNFEILNNNPILFYSLKEFDKNKYIDNIIIAVKENEIDIVNSIIKKHRFQKKIKLVVGGNTRKESVYNCIKQTNSDIVIIHDGARPAIKQSYINNCIECMDYYKGVTIGVKSKDTIKIADSNNIVINTTLRDFTWVIQTPQCFDRKVLLYLHNKYINDFLTDDCSLLEKENYKVKIIEGDYTNIKITTNEDMYIISNFIQQ